MNEGIEITNSIIIDIPFETFTIEYDIHNETWIAYYNDKDVYDYHIVIEGNITDEDGKITKYTLAEDKLIYDYVLTVKEFEELKRDIQESFK